MSGVAKGAVPSDALALAPGPIETWQQAWNVERRHLQSQMRREQTRATGKSRAVTLTVGVSSY